MTLDDDGPDVIGTTNDCPLPTPKEAWQAKYCLRLMEHGFTAEEAWENCRAAGDDSLPYDDDPREAADAELDAWRTL